MSNPFDGPEDDDTAREIREEIARMEREKLERERLAAEQADVEEAEFTRDEPLDGEVTELRLSDKEERLPWLESDDDLDDDGVDTGRIATVALIGLLAVVALVGAVWWFTRDKPDAELLADGSTITAPEEPFRARPTDPGGQEAAGTGDVSYEVGEGQDRATTMGAGTSPAPTPSPSASATPSIDRNQGASAAAAPASSGGVGVQVGAYSSRASAEAGWAQLAGQHSALSGVSHRVVQATVDGNSVFRLQAVAGNAAAADTLCRAIKSGGGDCRVAN